MTTYLLNSAIMDKINLYLITLICFSCGVKNNGAKNKDVISFISKISTIPIDRKTSPYTLSIQYKNEKLYWLNSNSISVINLKNQNVEKIIDIEIDGPNGISKPLGFFLQNEDSIFIPLMTYDINLINSSGKILSKFDYFNYSPLGSIIGSISRYSRSFMKVGNRLLFQIESLSILPREETNAESIKFFLPIISLDTQSGQFEAVDFKFPESILKPQNFISFSQTLAEKNILLLHERSNIFYEVNPLSWNQEEYILGSDLITNFSNEYYLSDRNSNSVIENMRLLYNSAQNLGIAYDSNNRMIYRFGWPGEEIPEEADPMKYSETPPFFIISIYDDEDYSLLKEFTLPRNTYLSHHYFVDENGLNLFPMHPENPEFNEDEMVIHTFDFSSLKK